MRSISRSKGGSGSQPVKALRSSVLNLLGMHGHDQKTIDEAFYQFGKYLKDKTAVAPDLLSPALSLVTFNGGKKEYNELLELWKSAREFSELVSNLLLLR